MTRAANLDARCPDVPQWACFGQLVTDDPYARRDEPERPPGGHGQHHPVNLAATIDFTTT
jgi:hypothetical protein